MEKASKASEDAVKAAEQAAKAAAINETANVQQTASRQNNQLKIDIKPVEMIKHDLSTVMEEDESPDVNKVTGETPLEQHDEVEKEEPEKIKPKLYLDIEPSPI